LKPDATPAAVFEVVHVSDDLVRVASTFGTGKDYCADRLLF